MGCDFYDKIKVVKDFKIEKITGQQSRIEGEGEIENRSSEFRS